MQASDFVINGVECRGIISRSQVSALMQAAGEIAIDEYTLTVFKDRLPARPVKNNKVTWNGKLWTVKADAEPENPTHYVLTIMREGLHR
jgi:hypothetical protein